MHNVLKCTRQSGYTLGNTLCYSVDAENKDAKEEFSHSLTLHINHSVIQLSLDAPLPLINWPFKLVNFKELFWNVLLSLPVILFQRSRGSNVIKSGTYQKCYIHAGWFSTSLCVSSTDTRCGAGGQGVHAPMGCIWISSFTCNFSRYVTTPVALRVNRFAIFEMCNSNRLSGTCIQTILTDEKSWYS